MSLTRAPERYDGTLSLEQVSEGIEACIDAAEEFTASAERLLAAGAAGPAVLLALVAMEELGKVSVLEKMAASNPRTDLEWKKAWKEFYNHRLKSAHSWHEIPSGALDSVSSAEENIDGFEAIGEQAFRHRQAAMFVAYDSGRHGWHSPVDIGEEEASSILGKARSTLAMKRFYHQVGAFSPVFLQKKAQWFSVVADMSRRFSADPGVSNKQPSEAVKESFRLQLQHAYREEADGLCALMAEHGDCDPGLVHRMREALADQLRERQAPPEVEFGSDRAPSGG